MCKIKTWVIDEKKHVRFYHDWNDKEVKIFFAVYFRNEFYNLEMS